MGVKSVVDLVIYAPDDDTMDAILQAFVARTADLGGTAHVVEKFREDA